jgi:diadenosine hexaphosphate hydrolase (ATP-forming)
MTDPALPADPGAGGVVLNAAGEVLLVRYRAGGWTFPKGHIEAGETLEQTAEREVLEETGVAAWVVAPLSTTRYANNRGVRREIHWFLMRADAARTRLEGIFEDGGFHAPAAAAGLLSYPQDQALLREALDLAGPRQP